MVANEGSRRRRSMPRPLWALVAVVALALATWLVLVERTAGMNAGPGTDPGALGWFLGVWVTMTAAMMLPSAVSMLTLFAHTTEERQGRARAAASTGVFLAGYLVVWTTLGLAAYALYHAVDALDRGVLDWDEAGPAAAGGAIVAAGLYQLTPLKDVCLRHCRGPLLYLLGRWRAGWSGAARLGFGHGVYCVGCCWGLMVVLFAVGAMSLFWMAVIASAVFAEKVLPHGDRLSSVLAVLLVLLGVWLAVAPASVPGVTDPDAVEMPAALP